MDKIQPIISAIKDKLQGRAPRGVKRSPQWWGVRKLHLVFYPECMVCGSRKKLEVHHIIPFHKAPELELMKSNLITLCESKQKGLNCHLAIGHLGSYKSYNENVISDAVWCARRLEDRP